MPAGVPCCTANSTACSAAACHLPKGCASCWMAPRNTSSSTTGAAMQWCTKLSARTSHAGAGKNASALHLVAAIDDLKYLRKGGRLPAAVAVAGGMLGIKPLITIKDGKVAMAGKARGLPGAYVALFKKIEELGGISPDFAAVAGYSSSLREVQPIENYFRENLHMSEPLVRQIGCVIGTHAGPGAFGLAFFDKRLVLE